MKYTPLSSLQNPYPSPSSYRVNEIGGATLQGVYSQNKLDFPIQDISELTVIPNANFRFVVAISDNNISNQILDLMVSEGLYNDLERAKNEPNPYFLNAILDPKVWVYIYIDPLHSTFEKNREKEKEIAVEVNYNVIFNGEGIPDFTRIGKFIDWVLTAPKLEDVETDGVIPLENLDVEFTLGAYDQENGQWVSAEKARFLATLDDLQDELNSVQSAIQEIDEFLDNPALFRRDGYVNSLIGASAAVLVTNVVTVTPSAAAAITLAAKSAAARALAATAFGGTVTTTAATAGKLATSLLGGPVGLGIAIAGIIFSIFASKKKKKEREEQVKRFSEYVQRITSDRIRLAQREVKLKADIEKLQSGETGNGGSEETSSTTTTNTSTTITTNTSGQSSSASNNRSPIVAEGIDPSEKPFFSGTYTGEQFVKPDGTTWVWLPAQGGWTKTGRKTNREL